MGNWLQNLDANLSAGLAEWNIYTTIILLLIFTVFIYPAFFTPEPDIHPLLLARQSVGSRIRHPGESATFRALDTPHSYPLKSGLNIRDEGLPRWQHGRDGDLRDIWRRAVEGPVDGEGKELPGKGKISVLLGKQEVIPYELETLSKEINAIGKQLKQHGGSRIAIYLPNSVEFLVTLFASAFYNFTPILIPQDIALAPLSTILNQTKADTLLLPAGSLALKDLLKLYPKLKQVIWVVPRSSRHVDWHSVPEGSGGKASISVWHEIIDESSAVSDLPPSEGESPNIITVFPTESEKATPKIVEYTQNNLTAAISSQLSALPRSYTSIQQHNLTPLDTLLPLAPLTTPYVLTLTLSALYSSSHLALTTLTSPTTLFKNAFLSKTIHPTILIAQPPTLLNLHSANVAQTSSPLSNFLHNRSLSSLKGGVLPKSLHQGLRLIYTYSNSPTTPLLTTATLNDLRVFTGARIVVAHTAPEVAGAVTQTHVLDYGGEGREAHIGQPPSCLEIKLLAAKGEEDIDDEDITGIPLVSGPAVVGGSAKLEQSLRVTHGRVFAYT